MSYHKDPAAALELCEKATPGPWKVYADFNVQTDKRGVANCGGYSSNSDDSYETNKANAQFIALSREALPYWVARALELERECERLQKVERAARELYYMSTNAGDFRNGNTYQGIDEGTVMAEKVFVKFEQALKDGDSDGN